MMKHYLRGATAVFVLTVFTSPYPGSRSAMAADAVVAKSAIVAPAIAQIDAFGYAGGASSPTSDTGKLLASASSAVPRFGAMTSGSGGVSAAASPTPLSWMPSYGALGLMSSNRLQTESLKSLYQLAR